MQWKTVNGRPVPVKSVAERDADRVIKAQIGSAPKEPNKNNPQKKEA